MTQQDQEITSNSKVKAGYEGGGEGSYFSVSVTKGQRSLLSFIPKKKKNKALFLDPGAFAIIRCIIQNQQNIDSHLKY